MEICVFSIESGFSSLLWPLGRKMPLTRYEMNTKEKKNYRLSNFIKNILYSKYNMSWIWLWYCTPVTISCLSFFFRVACPVLIKTREFDFCALFCKNKAIWINILTVNWKEFHKTLLDNLWTPNKRGSAAFVTIIGLFTFAHIEGAFNAWYIKMPKMI